ncbi:CYtochrome P450 family [Aphelenchoides bicaudatus]|nr:CYtochrome P450 family [Aphelenchoides bicaudatus]
MAERSKLPYLMATINEIQRLANLVPFNIPRKLTRLVSVNGYALEAGTAISACVSLLLYDEKIFPKPYEFKPELGRRLCIGRDLAKLELFLFFANFMNRYQVLPSEHHSLPSLKLRDFFLFFLLCSTMVLDNLKRLERKRTFRSRLRVHGLTLGIIVGVAALAYGLRKAALALRGQFDHRVDRYHEEVEDFMYNREMAAKRRQMIEQMANQKS